MLSAHVLIVSGLTLRPAAMTVRTSAHIGVEIFAGLAYICFARLCKQERLYSTFVGAYIPEYLHVYTQVCQAGL